MCVCVIIYTYIYNYIECFLTKIFFIGPYIESKLFSNKLVLTEWVEDGTSYFTYRWTKETVGEPYLIPFSVSVLVTLFTWVIIYLDSRTPGENPPSPFAKSKYRYFKLH